MNREVAYKCSSCTPWNKMYWGKVKVPENMDPALYNVLNGCWLCNFDKQNLENDYIMDRSFFNGDCGAPCNKVEPFDRPRDSRDQ